MKLYQYLILIIAVFLFANGCTSEKEDSSRACYSETSPFIRVLGIAQDAGFPQANCQKDCCTSVWQEPHKREKVSCLSIIDPVEKTGWIFDATPDFKDQLYLMENSLQNGKIALGGIFLTHAHMGHYTGLMHLGREAMGAKKVPVYTMPRMKNYLENNGPWSQLVTLENVQLRALKSDSTIVLNKNIKVTPLLVPHRDEFSETVGFLIETAEKKALFIPDIDKWHLWERDILDLIKTVDVAYLDGTFFENGEIPGRDMSQIPHPFMEESMALFESLDAENKLKIRFIHFNHTNPVLKKMSTAHREVRKKGFRVAREGVVFEMGGEN
jgi:pyrroloquinoline quinone biosynthesis protein B